MCEQTEINYLDGDVVWVKIGACWWPGQVTGFHNLPEDIQIEFQKKPLIAAVKFFQEDTYEFVKNLHQIYKYNCTQKDEFIRKGLDKYRTKSKDGSSYMHKFPGDVEMAEKLTGGDPDILTSEKFCREEKPDISALFGEKKIPKKKRDRDETGRRSEGNTPTRKITHPRFLRESDHEIRIRQQPSSLPNTPRTPNTDSPQFSCNLCNFTTTRVNVIICHRKSHCGGGGTDSPLVRGRMVSYAQPRSAGRTSLPSDTQKRKYVRKTKSLSSKGKSERETEPVKRKLAKQTEKTAAKKKKTDPELREKLLADWDDETDEDMDLDMNKSADAVSIGSSSVGNNSAPPNNSSDNNEDKEDDGNELIKASEKLLRETEKFASLHVDDSSSRASRHSSNKHLDDLDSETDTSTSTLAKEEKSPAYKRPKKLIASATEERKSTGSEKDDKQSRFSCFDFDEEDLPEPAITPVRKIPRIFGEKNTSVKKEILKKFTMSQAMKSAKDEEKEQCENVEKVSSVQDFLDKKEPTAKEKMEEDTRENETTGRSNVEERMPDNDSAKAFMPAKSEDNRDKSSKVQSVTELEIVEIFEVEGEKDEREDEDSKKSVNYEIETFSLGASEKKSEDKFAIVEESDASKNPCAEISETERDDKNYQPEKEETLSELATTETEDETVSELTESLRGNSENSDLEANPNRATWSDLGTTDASRDATSTGAGKPTPRRRGRPRKSLPALESSGNGNDSPRREMIIGKKVAALASRDSERKTSESDSERSYSGRRRKPNKRYLHAELYTSSPDTRASRTDESQSDTEDKSHKEQKSVRARGGKKKLSHVANEARLEAEKNAEPQFPLADRNIETIDRAAAIEIAHARIDEEISRVVELPEAAKAEIAETAAESSSSGLVKLGKKHDSGIGSPVNITKILSPGKSETCITKNSIDQESGNEKISQPGDKFSVIETVAMTPEDMEVCADETKSGTKFDSVKTSVDKLPPKKSQIKKFELSQIDLLDACEEQVAAEQAAAERRIAERLEAERLAAEKLAEEKMVAEKLAEEKLAAEKLAEEKLAAEKLEAERLAAERMEAERLAAEKLEDEKLAAEKLEAERLAAEKLEAERLAAEKLEAERLAAEKIETERLAAEKLEAERLAAEKLEAERLADEKIASEKLAAEKLAAEKRAAEQEAADKVAAEQALAEKAAEEKLAKEDKVETRLAEAEQSAEEPPIAKEKAKDECTEVEAKSQVVDPTAVPEKVEKTTMESVPVATHGEDPPPLPSEIANAGTATDSTMETIEAVLARITNEQMIEVDKTSAEVKLIDKVRTSDTIKIDKTPTKATIPVDNEAAQRSVPQPRYKGAKFTPEVGTRGKRTIADEEIPINSFQEAFLKTLHIDKKGEKDEPSDISSRKPKQQQQQHVPSTENAEPQQTFVIAIAGGNNESQAALANVREPQTVQPLNAMTEFEGVEILVQDNMVEVETKIDDSNVNQMDLAATLVGTDQKQDARETLTLDLQKIQDTLSDSVSTPSPPSELGVPVKKREKPRIIESVTLKEPMQILKNKLLEKLPGKSTKHKLETDNQKKPETKGAPRAKMMKLDSGNGKTRSPTKAGGSHFTITRKLQVLKAEEAATAAAIEKDKVAAQIAQTISMPGSGEKFIQASSQSLADMELDINSMPFVLSEDVLTPESIEHMPVVISSIIPSASTSVATTLSLATGGQLTATNAEAYKCASDTVTAESTGKKKSGTPAILKNKSKAKPTITSIKTLVPPFAGGVKGLKFQSQQTAGGKAMPLMSQKSATPGKYVIVQTAGGQQMRYSVQGKPGSQQKIAIPAGKATGSAQIVQQGGKVVILTSAQSGQTKMLPLNISKSMSGKVQKIVNNKGQIYAPMSPQTIAGQKTMIAPKTEAPSPTTSKLAQGQKILNTQGIITSKGVLTPIATSKSGLLGTLSQGILTKGGIYTPISTAQLAGKTIISGKTLVSKATTILSPLGSQALGTSKGTIIAPMSHTIAGKTIINAQGLVTPKGTVLTPITGQQVKAIAAKSPGKTAKIHYQPVQQKLQLPMLQKCQKIPVSSSTQQQARVASSVKSPIAGTIVFPPGAQKTASPAGKKIVRQIGQQGVRSPQQMTQLNATCQQVTQKSKSVGTATPNIQRVATPRGAGRQSKQKIIVQKIHESSGPDGATIVTTQQVKSIASTATQIGSATKCPLLAGAQKQSPFRAGKSGKNAQKNLLNVVGASSVATSTIGSNESGVVASSVSHASSALAQSLHNMPVPPLVIPGTELPLNEDGANLEKSTEASTTRDNAKRDETSTKAASSVDGTIEEPKLELTTTTTTTNSSKMTSQPQIMALPTESSDGTQTYVLVTIDEQGQIQPLDNNTLMSLEGTTQNADGTRTLYIDPSSLGEAGALDNIVLQFDNGAMPNIQSNVAAETSRAGPGIVAADTFATSEIIQSSNQDILAAALANTDFQQEIGLPDNATSSVMSAGLTQTSLINQTILQSTIIPPTEPISSPSVLETSLTLNQPIMTPLEVPSSLPIQVVEVPPPASVISTIPTSLELPITITNPSISYITTGAGTAESHMTIPGNSMPDIGEIMESSASGDATRTDIPTSTRYLVLPNLDQPITTRSSESNETEESTVPVTYSVSIPDSLAIDNTQAQTTPSMPIIDDAYVETTEQSFGQVTINEMLVSKASTMTESTVVASENVQSITSQVSTQACVEHRDEAAEPADTGITESPRIDSYVPDEVAERMIVEPEAPRNETPAVSDEKVAESSGRMMVAETGAEIITTCTPALEVSRSSVMQVESDELTGSVPIESTHARNVGNVGEDTSNVEHREIAIQDNVTSHDETSCVQRQERTSTTPSLDSPSRDVAQVASASMELESGAATSAPIVEDAVEMEIYPCETAEITDPVNTVEGSSSASIVECAARVNVEARDLVATEAGQEEETPSQSYEQRFDDGPRVASDSPETPTQSATKSENSREPTQSVAYEAMEIDEGGTSGEPPTQSFEDTKRNEASQSYETSIESNTNAPTQSFNEIMQCQEEDEIEEPSTGADAIDDQSFPTQSYEVDKMDDLSENLESDASAIGQEQGNIPSQSNDVGNDVGIGTSGTSVNNSGLNEDETASSSYVPETPENQERDQDQESAISTSSYEIPPCEELNIASSSVIPDTSVSRASEHMCIHDNGVPEIPTSSYNLNPDSSSTSRVGDALPTSSYEEDQVIVEQNVSTSYEVPISMPGIEENSSQNFVTESTDHRRNAEQPTSYYAHRHTEVTASYYEAVNQESSSRLEADPQEEVTPSYYEQPRDVTSEASQSYFRAAPRYPSQSVSPSYYDPTPETEASQSSYYSHEIEGTEQSSSRNVEASQSFYQETTDERRLGQRGEATPTYTERYPVDYALANSPIERHDLVESSVPATRPTER